MSSTLIVIYVIICIYASSSYASLRIMEDTLSTSSDIVFEESSNDNRSTEFGIVHSGSDIKNELNFKTSMETQEGSEVRNKPIIFTTQEKHVVYGTQTGRLVLAGVMGACIGLFSGFLLTVIGCCCYLRLSHRYGTLEFDKHNNTYRSAELIDGVV